jgi:ubiquinone/menaquinone biosynthesis C-methylase UbiE
MNVNLGSGHSRVEGYINVDHDPNCSPDYVVDLEKDNLPFEDNSVDNINARHVFEHIGGGYFHMLKEIYRVCKNGAMIDIVVPHWNHDYFKNDPTHKRPITVDGMTLFSKKYNRHCIEIGDGSSQLGLFYDVDFEIIEWDYHIDPHYSHMLSAIQEGKLPQEEFQQIIRSCNNVVMEVSMKVVVVKDE